MTRHRSKDPDSIDISNIPERRQRRSPSEKTGIVEQTKSQDECLRGGPNAWDHVVTPSYSLELNQVEAL